MKRVHVTADELESIAWRTGRQIETTATEGFVRLERVEYHAPLSQPTGEVA